jgi:hypothetical protein
MVRYSLAAGLGWILFQVLVEVLLGPHISLARTVTLGAGIGAYVGLLVSTLQWLTLRRYVTNGGWWIPATTAGCAAGGVVGGFFYSMTARHIGPFDITLPSGGIIESLAAGFILASFQWLVLRNWVRNARAWVMPITLGMGLAVSIGWLAGAGTLGLLNWLFGLGMWPLLMIVSAVVGGLAGGATFALCSAWALHRVLPQPGAIVSIPAAHQVAVGANPG